MTETRSIAEMIRDAEKPQGFGLADKARRLQDSLKVAEKWMEAADSSASGEMAMRAETIRDEIGQELSRVAWEMEAACHISREKALNERRDEERKVSDTEGVARASALSNALVEAYLVLTQVPPEHLDMAGEASEGTRYRLMGALLVAREAADAEVKRLDPNAYV